MFTHTSWDDFRILESQLRRRLPDDGAAHGPVCRLHGPRARAGRRDREGARKGDRAIRVGRFAMRDNSKARELSETDGFIKVVVDARTARGSAGRRAGRGRVGAGSRLRGR